MPSLDIRRDPARPFGHALLVIEGIESASDARFHLRRRNQEPFELGPKGWQNGPALLDPMAVVNGPGHLVLTVGPEVVDRLELDTPIELELPALRVTLAGYWPDVPPTPGGGRGADIVGARSEADAPAPLPEQPGDDTKTVLQVQLPREPEPDPGPLHKPEEDLPPPAPAPVRRNLPWLLLAALVLVVAVSGYIWFEKPCLVGKLGFDIASCTAPAATQIAEPPITTPTAPVVTTPSQPTVTTPPATNSPRDLAGRFDDLEHRVPAATGAEFFGLAQEALAAGNADLGFKAMEESVDMGHAPALLQYGRWYDPRHHDEAHSPFRNADPVKAMDYYKRARDAGSAEAAAEIAGLCQKLATDGPAETRQTLCPPG